MESRRFDALAKHLASPASRRTTLRLLAGSLLGGFLAERGEIAHAAQRPDRDGDGLYDDDETNVYGTNPDVYDTDGDGVGDGEEIYRRDNGLGGPSDPLTPEGGAPAPAGCAAGLTNCGGVCVNLSYDNANCGACGVYCGFPLECIGGACVDGGIDFGGVGCAAGLTDCGGVCVDLNSDARNCGACGYVCPGYGEICAYGVCTFPGNCPAGQTLCGGVCQVGDCVPVCPAGLARCGGGCVDLMTDVNNCGYCGGHCFIPIIGDPECVNGVCNP